MVHISIAYIRKYNNLQKNLKCINFQTQTQLQHIFFPRYIFNNKNENHMIAEFHRFFLGVFQQFSFLFIITFGSHFHHILIS